MTTNHDPLTNLLASHAYTYPDSFCTCDAYVGDSPWVDHPAHLADVVRGWLTTDPNSPLAAVIALADEWERIADAIAITYQNPDDRYEATRGYRAATNALRAALTATHPTKEQQP